MGRKQPKFKPYVHNGDNVGNEFLLLPPELFKEPKFQALTYAARWFYLLLCTHRESSEQQDYLYSTLKVYNEILNLGMSDLDLKLECYPHRKIKSSKNFFVFPESHMRLYGIRPNYAHKLMRELVTAGFIKKAFGGKGRYDCWKRNATVYKFSDAWKRSETEGENAEENSD